MNQRGIIVALLIAALAGSAGASMWYIPVAERVPGGFDHIQLWMCYPYNFESQAMIAFSGAPPEPAEQWSQTFINDDFTFVTADGPNLGTLDLYFSIVIAGDRNTLRPAFHFQAYRNGFMVDNADFTCFGPGEGDWMVASGTWPLRRKMPPFPPGDGNLDGAVDMTDYALWFNNYGKSGMTLSQGDFDGSGQVDMTDYALWFNNYGLDWSGSVSVPESTTAALLVLGGVAILRRRRT